MLNLERLGNITAELSANLVRSIVLPGGLLRCYARTEGERSAAEPERKVQTSNPVLPGSVVLAGADALTDDIVVEIIHLAGGRKSRLAVVPLSVLDWEAQGEAGVRMFRRFGVEHVEVLPLITRERADSPYWADQLLACDGVVLLGDDPIAAAAILNGTPSHEAMKAALAQDKVVAAVGGCAGVLAEAMLSEDGVLQPGLGLVPRFAVDSAAPRPRLSTLVKAMGTPAHTAWLGLCLEAAAGAVVREGEVRVIGENSAIFVDGRDIAPPEEVGNELALVGSEAPVCGVKVHVLVAGYGLSLRTRRPMGPARTALPAQAIG